MDVLNNYGGLIPQGARRMRKRDIAYNYKFFAKGSTPSADRLITINNRGVWISYRDGSISQTNISPESLFPGVSRLDLAQQKHIVENAVEGLRLSAEEISRWREWRQM